MSLYEDENKMVIGELWHDEKDIDDYLVDCMICCEEVDEEETMYGICEKCWADAHTFDNAILYGHSARTDVSVNGYYAALLTQVQIDNALKELVMDVRREYYSVTDTVAQKFLKEDSGNFADWLKERNVDQ